MFSKSRILYLSVFVTLLTMVIAVAVGHAARSEKQLAQPSDESEILQFTSSGHVLGFHSKGVYVASGSHMLKENFSGTKGTVATADQVPAKDGKAQPLEKVVYQDLWNGITLIYDRPPGGIIRSTYYIESWRNPDQIALRYNVPVHLDGAGNIVFELATGTMNASAPVAWQEIDEKKVPVNTAFHLDASNKSVHFKVGHYNPAFPLIIDPTLIWNTFIGSSGSDYGSAIAVDKNGNIYIAGYSSASWGSPVNDHHGSSDCFVAKLTSNGETVWHTFIGSPEMEYGNAVAVSETGNVFVTGYGETDWGNPLHPHTGGLNDVFVVRLNSSGETVWTTFMGASGNDRGEGIAVDNDENVYVAGEGGSWGNPLNPHNSGYDAFVVKLTSSGETVWHTYMGSTNAEYAYGMVLDENENIYVAGIGYGVVWSNWGTPVDPHSPTNTQDVFVAKLTGNGETVWHTFMGTGQSVDYCNDVAVDGSGNVFVIGAADTTWGNPLNPFAGADKSNYNAYVAKLNNSGETVWNTFLGSSGGDDRGQDITVDNKGDVYAAGKSSATWGTPKMSYKGGDDVFMVKLNNSGDIKWNAFLGSSSTDGCGDIALDSYGKLYITGYSYATWGNPVNGYNGGTADAFVAKLLIRNLMPWRPLLLLDSSE